MPKPKVFVNKINKDIKNNKNSYHFTGGEILDNTKVDVKEKIRDIFKSDTFVYKSSVTISLKNGRILRKDIIAYKNDELITLDNERINVSDIVDIKKAK